MAIPWLNRLEDYEASFPGAVFTPVEARNEDQDGVAVEDEALAVPALADYAGKRRLVLDYVPLEQSGFAIVDGGAVERRLIPWGETPASGEVAVSMIHGGLEFHADDAGVTLYATYRGKGTPLAAWFLLALQREIEALETRELGNAHRLADVTGIDLRSSGQTLLLAAQEDDLIIERAHLVVTSAAEALSEAPSAKIEDEDGNVIFDEDAMWNLTDVGQVWTFGVSGPGPRYILEAGKALYLNITIAGTGTGAVAAKAIVRGFEA